MTATYVTPAPTYTAPPPPPAPLARIDVDGVTRDAFAAINTTADAYLRQIAPLPAWRTDGPYPTTIDAPPPGIAAPHEAHERSRRYGWTLIAVVMLAIVATGGLAFTGHELGMIANVGLTIAMWIGAGGSLAIYLVARLQAHDLAHSPEAVALVRERAAAYATETGADAAAGVAAAYADTLRLQAQAQAATQQAQAAALGAHVAQLAAPPPAPRRVRACPERSEGAPGIAQPQAWHLDANGEPQPGAAPLPAPPACPPCPPLSPPAPALEYVAAVTPAPAGVDPVAGLVLAWVASLYDDPAALDPRDRRILVELPWSGRARGEYALPKAERARVRDALLSVQPPLFAALPGNAVALVGRSKWFALEKVKGVLG